METKQHGGQRANSGRKPLPDTAKKKTSVIRIDAELLPLVEKLKQGLPVTQNQVWQQTTALSDADLKEQANYIERLTTDKAQLSAQVQQLENQLQKIKIDNDTVKAELARVQESNQLSSNGNLQAKLDNLLQANVSLVTQRDSANVEIQKLKSIVQEKERAARMKEYDFNDLKKRLENITRKFDAGTGKACQCITSNGTQCTRPADKLIKTNDVMIWTCKQHRAKHPTATQVL